LLGKFPSEPKLATDDAWDCHSKEWKQTFTFDGDQVETVWYRRRIEPVPKFAVGQMVRVVGPKEIPALEWSSVGMAQYAGTTQTIERVELLTSPPSTYYHLKGVVNWCFREDYLEPVEPEPKHYVLRVGDTVETPSGHRVQVVSRGETQRTYALTAGGKVTLPNGQTITATAKGFEVS
jgi:predicted oxidoreductase